MLKKNSRNEKKSGNSQDFPSKICRFPEIFKIQPEIYIFLNLWHIFFDNVLKNKYHKIKEHKLTKFARINCSFKTNRFI